MKLYVYNINFIVKLNYAIMFLQNIKFSGSLILSVFLSADIFCYVIPACHLCKLNQGLTKLVSTATQASNYQ